MRDQVADERYAGERRDLDIGHSRQIRRCPGGPVELVIEKARQPERQDVERHPRHDLVASQMDRGYGMDPGKTSADGHRRDERHDHAVRLIGGDDSEERSDEHAALERDVDDPGALRDHTAERRQQDRRCEAQRRREDSGADELIDRHAMASSGLRPRRRAVSKRTTSSAAMTKRTIASMTETSCADTPALACMIEPPRANAPKRRAASAMPIGEFFPRRATAMASKP